MDAELIRTPRLTLIPLAVEHAAEMAEALDDPALHAFIGGSPATPAELHSRYTRMVAGPPPGRDEAWLNWVIRLHPSQDPNRSENPGTLQSPNGPEKSSRSESPGGADPLTGYVQATVTPAEASVAWVVGTPWQGRGIAGEAALALVTWLRNHGVSTIVATVHPDHAVSSAVARRAGLLPTDVRVDGEVVWTSQRVQ
jgi:RimJ/RimL family protein N-acetyltransferase